MDGSKDEDIYDLQKKEDRIMSVEKDFIDFIKDATEDPSRVSTFLGELCEQGANEEALCQLLHGWGYKGVRVRDCAAILHAAGHQGAWRSEMQKDY